MAERVLFKGSGIKETILEGYYYDQLTHCLAEAEDVGVRLFRDLFPGNALKGAVGTFKILVEFIPDSETKGQGDGGT